MSEDKWISVDDELPNNSNGVLICNDNGVGEGYYHRWARDENGGIVGMEDSDLKDGWEWAGEGFKVEPQPTHWMPLPLPPTGGRNVSRHR